jgi:hypothetical protein
MDEFLTVTDGTRQLKVNRGDAIRVELKLNTSPFGFKWSSIGDALFNFGSNRKEAVSILSVTIEQFTFLEEVFNMLDYYREKPIS